MDVPPGLIRDLPGRIDYRPLFRFSFAFEAML